MRKHKDEEPEDLSHLQCEKCGQFGAFSRNTNYDLQCRTCKNTLSMDSVGQCIRCGSVYILSNKEDDLGVCENCADFSDRD